MLPRAAMCPGRTRILFIDVRRVVYVTLCVHRWAKPGSGRSLAAVPCGATVGDPRGPHQMPPNGVTRSAVAKPSGLPSEAALIQECMESGVFLAPSRLIPTQISLWPARRFAVGEEVLQLPLPAASINGRVDSLPGSNKSSGISGSSS